MARTPIADRPLIAQWLIRTREQAGMTADQFRAALASEGKGVDYSTYAQWESGKQTPKEGSLAPVFAFWAKRGVEPPSIEAPQRPLTLEEQQLAALREQNEWLRAYIQRTDTRITFLEEMVRALTLTRQSPELEAMGELVAQGWAPSATESSTSPLPAAFPATPGPG